MPPFSPGLDITFVPKPLHLSTSHKRTPVVVTAVDVSVNARTSPNAADQIFIVDLAIRAMSMLDSAASSFCRSNKCTRPFVLNRCTRLEFNGR